jgi:predicted N-acyltransferase
LVFDNYNTKIEKTYYYAIHNTIESKIIGLEGYSQGEDKRATGISMELYFKG